MKLKEKINMYFKKLNYSEQDIALMDTSSVYIAYQISAYAHKDQKRVNGDNYFFHPYDVLKSYKDLIGIKDDDYFCVDVDELILTYNIPYHGVQEVCLLHDVLEDSNISIDEIEEIYNDLSLGDHFLRYIKKPLLLITHDKNEDYLTYINKMLDNPTACLVKLLDMNDNMKVISLTKLTNYELDRINRYAFHCKQINDKWNFLQNINKYRKNG